MSKISFRSILKKEKETKKEETSEPKPVRKKESGKDKQVKTGKVKPVSIPEKEEPVKEPESTEEKSILEEVRIIEDIDLDLPQEGKLDTVKGEESPEPKKNNIVEELPEPGKTEIEAIEVIPEPIQEKPEEENAKVVSLSSIFKIQRREAEENQKEEPEKNEPESEQEEEPEKIEKEKPAPESEKKEFESDQLITFYLGSEQYGLDILDAREVKQILPLTPIPRSVDWVMGIVNLRGIVFPVVDLKKRLNIQASVEYPLNLRRIIIIEIEDMRIGLLVDKINMIVNKHTLEYSTPPTLISGGEDFISLIAKKDELIISVISLHKLFTIEERELLAKIKKDET